MCFALCASVAGAATEALAQAPQTPPARATVSPPDVPTAPSEPAGPSAAPATPSSEAPAASGDAPPSVHIAIILPGKIPAYGRAVQAIKAGMEGAQRVAERPVSLEFIDTDDDPQAVAAQLSAASERADVLIGPLTRSVVTRLARSYTPERPVVMLNWPDGEVMPAAGAGKMLFFSLSLEVEARQSAGTMLAQSASTGGRIAVASQPGPLYRRVAQAFLKKLEAAGAGADWVESLDSAEVRRAARGAALVFVAGDAAYAARVRPFLPRNAEVYATSQVNTDDGTLLSAKYDLEGVHFTDAPWLIDRDSPSVLAYLRPDTPDAPRMNFDAERLYAFGLDSVRLALAWLQAPRFDLEGVTGLLAAAPDENPYVRRSLARGVIKDGAGVHESR